MNRYDTFKMDMKLLEYLKQNKGAENVRSRKEVKKFLDSEGYSIALSSVPATVSRVRQRFNAPICFVNSNGYFYATSKQELQSSIDDLEKRRDSLQEHIDFLKSFMLY